MANEKVKDLEVEKFYKGLSDAEWDEAGAIEAEVEKLLDEGLSEEAGVGLVRTVMQIRKVMPEATVEGILELVFHYGLLYVGSEHMLKRLRSGAADGIKAQRVRKPGQGQGQPKRGAVRGV
jgi:hypothetical protein